MIGEDVFGVDPWSVPEHELSLDGLAHTESVFALSNGHIGLRGNLDEGEPSGHPGTYLNGFYETRPLPYAEAGYGNPESGETMINVTNGKILRLLVDDEPFDLRYGTSSATSARSTCATASCAARCAGCSPAGQGVILRSTRLVSFVQRSVGRDPLRGRALRRARRGSSCSPSSSPTSRCREVKDDDPRAAAALRRPLVGEEHGHTGCARARPPHARLELRMAAGMDHVVDGPEDTVTAIGVEPDLARVTVATELKAGQTLRIVKFLAYGWSSRRSLPAMRDQVDAALAAALHTGWDGLLHAQREYLDDFWARADVELDGDPALQQAVRFALFQRAAVGRARRAPRDPGEGADRHAATTATPSGTWRPTRCRC